MSYSTTIAQGDTASLKEVVLLDAAGVPVALSAAVTFSQVAKNGTIIKNNVAATTVDAANGLVGFPADVSAAGTFSVRWRTTFGGKQLSFPDEAPALLVVVPA